MGIVDRIKVLCTVNKTSIADLEIELGFSKGSIYKWDKSSPSFEKVIKIAERFNVSLDYLAGKDNNDDVPSMMSPRKKMEITQNDIEVMKKLSSYLSDMADAELIKK